jgi:hypothetical protein
MPPPPCSIQCTHCYMLEGLPLTNRTEHFLIKGTTVHDLCYEGSTRPSPLAKVGIYSITMYLNAHSGKKRQCLLHHLLNNVHYQAHVPLTGSDLFQSSNNTVQQNPRITK